MLPTYIAPHYMVGSNVKPFSKTSNATSPIQLRCFALENICRERCNGQRMDEETISGERKVATLGRSIVMDTTPMMDIAVDLDIRYPILVLPAVSSTIRVVLLEASSR